MSNVKAQTTGTYTEPGDGHVYKTVEINGTVWMTEDLAFKKGFGCRAYDNDESNVETYAYLYSYYTAADVCPDGWHLSTKVERTQLLDYSSDGKIRTILIFGLITGKY